MKKTENNYAFIDSQNVHLSVKAQGWDLDWRRFRVYLKFKYKVSKAFLFIGFVENNNKLYEKLQEAGFICIFKPTLEYADGTRKGNVDAELVMHAILKKDEYEKAVVVTGDGDFYCLIEYLTEQDKLKQLLVPNQYRYSALLKRFAKKHIAFLGEAKNKIKRTPQAYHAS